MFLAPFQHARMYLAKAVSEIGLPLSDRYRGYPMHPGGNSSPVAGLKIYPKLFAAGGRWDGKCGERNGSEGRGG